MHSWHSRFEKSCEDYNGNVNEEDSNIVSDSAQSNNESDDGGTIRNDVQSEYLQEIGTSQNLVTSFCKMKCRQ